MEHDQAKAIKANYKQQHKNKMLSRNRSSRSSRISFSANLPSDVCGVWADNTMCAVLYTKDPFFELQQSILEMVREVGICDWGEMEELVYCYIALNSSEVHRYWEAGENRRRRRRVEQRFAQKSLF